MKIKIGFQGVSGAYSEMAAESFAKGAMQDVSKSKTSKDFELVGYRDFDSIFQAVHGGKLDFGVVPVENSLAGSIHRNFDLLGQHELKVVGEVYVHVNHQLLVLPGAKKEDIKEVYSHWQALAQCEHNLKNFLPNALAVEYFDTAASSKFVKETGDKTKAAISSVKAGKTFGLKVLQKDFQDDKSNYTRFLAIAPKYANLKNEKKKDYYKTSIIFYGGNVAGFLFKALGCFSLRDINLSKIESRPVPKSPWQYYFYLDFEGKYDDEKVVNAINNLKEIATEVKVLGSYKAGKN
jgi:prephenate dehydratase